MRKPRRKSPNDRWTRDPAKEKYWRTQIANWQESGLSVRAFCKENGVVETSFYAWRRELIIRAREDHSPEQLEAVGNTPNKLRDGRGRNVSIRFRQTDHRALQSIVAEPVNKSPFVPLSVVPDCVQQERTVHDTTVGRVEITLTTPSGYQLSISHVSDFDSIAKLLNTLEKNQC
jgi:hypothetical protein